MRVFITGLGPLCALGNNYRALWDSLLSGRSGVSRLTRLAGSPVSIGAEVSDQAVAHLVPRDRRLDRTAQMAIAAAGTALQDAGLDEGVPAASGDRAGVVVGSSRGATERLEQWHGIFLKEGPEAVGAHASPHTTAGNMSGAVARRFGLRGPALSVAAACASATQAIGVAFDFVRHGRADLMVAGGTEAALTPFSIAMFAKAGMLSTGVRPPEAACRPFDRDRDGIVVGEGAGMIVLESEEHARRRGARLYAEVLGFGSSCDALSLTAVPDDGAGLARAIRLSLADARLAPEAVEYVNAHGTGTRAGDRSETMALKAALGAHAHRTVVSSTKSMTGHMIGATGGIEAIVCALAITEGAVPPTINLEHPDPDCDLDFVPGQARSMPVRHALSISMGFGGNNACLAFGPA
jgi:3-oxoacyl-[acyl-carrier-protein] synthase II